MDQGYTYIEVTARVTKDLRCVALCDTTINRTARCADGSPVGASLPVAWVNYDQLLAFDFGIGYHVKFKGTKLPLLEDVLALARKSDIKLKIAAGCWELRQTHREALLNLLDAYQDVAELTVKTVEALQETVNRYPKMHLHWENSVDAEILNQIAAILPREKITFWLGELSERLIAQVKEYGGVGVGELHKAVQLTAAEKLGVDVVATNGALKPVQNQGLLSDMHVHTDHSHDARYPMEQMVQKGIEHGIRVMAIADHCDVTRCENDPNWDIYTNIREACEEVDQLNEKYGDQCLLLRSVELGDGIWYPAQSGRVTEQLPYDVIVGSMHAVRCEAAEAIPLKEKWYSQIKFLDLTEEQYDEFMRNYFDDMLTMVQTQNIDIMAHLLCASCYYGYRYGIWKDMRPYERQITDILKTVISKGIAMEMDGQLFLEIGGQHPYYWIVEKYYDLGGYLITLSTDAHDPREVGIGYEKRIPLLKATGFTHILYYKDRKIVPCSL